MDLFVFVSKQCSIAEPSGWPWRERERDRDIHCVNLGLVFQAFQCMSHPSYIAHEIYINININIYIYVHLLFPLRLGK